MYHWHGPVEDARPGEISGGSFQDMRPPSQVSRSKSRLTRYLRKAVVYAAFGCLAGVCGAAALGYINVYLGVGAGVALFIGALISWGFYVLDCEILH